MHFKLLLQHEMISIAISANAVSIWKLPLVITIFFAIFFCDFPGKLSGQAATLLSFGEWLTKLILFGKVDVVAVSLSHCHVRYEADIINIIKNYCHA